MIKCCVVNRVTKNTNRNDAVSKMKSVKIGCRLTVTSLGYFFLKR